VKKQEGYRRAKGKRKERKKKEGIKKRKMSLSLGRIERLLLISKKKKKKEGKRFWEQRVSKREIRHETGAHP
jgi:hypothetical protein